MEKDERAPAREEPVEVAGEEVTAARPKAAEKDRIRTERVLNLLIALRAASGWIDRDSLKEGIEAYRPLGDQAFDRMFSRDKAALRALGIRISTRSWIDDHTAEKGYGYRITDEDYTGGPLELDTTELGVLAVAQSFWNGTELGTDAAQAMHKLRGLSAQALPELDPSAPVDDAHDPSSAAPAASILRSAVVPEVANTLPAGTFRLLVQAADEAQALSFTYRKPTGETKRRRVEPYGVSARGHRVYLVGHDLDRADLRVFRISRILDTPKPLRGRHAGDYTVPEGFDPASVLTDPEDTAPFEARLLLAPGAGDPLRRAGRVETSPVPGLDLVSVPVDDAEELLAYAVPFAQNAVLVSPLDLARVQRERLETTRTALEELLGTAPLPEPEAAPAAAASSGETPIVSAPAPLATDPRTCRGAPAAPDRLARLLGLVPYLTSRPGADLGETAAHFGVSKAELVDDLELLFVTGRPGHMPDDLIDADWTDGRITVTNAEEVAVPVRLSPFEAATSLLAVRYVAAFVDDDGPVRSVAAKLEALASRGTTRRLEVRVPEVDPRVARTLRSALDAGTALHLTYYVAGRDELTHRTITPRRLFLNTKWYLSAWCHDTADVRTFALDAIRELAPAPEDTDLTEARPSSAGATPEEDPHARGRAPRTEGAVGEGAPPAVRLRLRARAAWLVDELPARDVVFDVEGTGDVALTLDVRSAAWFERFLLHHATAVVATSAHEHLAAALALAEAGLARIAEVGPTPAGPEETTIG